MGLTLGRLVNYTSVGESAGDMKHLVPGPSGPDDRPYLCMAGWNQEYLIYPDTNYFSCALRTQIASREERAGIQIPPGTEYPPKPNGILQQGVMDRKRS